VDGSWRVHALGEEGMWSEFEGLSNVSAVLQTKKAKAGIETFQYVEKYRKFQLDLTVGFWKLNGVKLDGRKFYAKVEI